MERSPRSHSSKYLIALDMRVVFALDAVSAWKMSWRPSKSEKAITLANEALVTASNSRILRIACRSVSEASVEDGEEGGGENEREGEGVMRVRLHLQVVVQVDPAKAVELDQPAEVGEVLAVVVGRRAGHAPPEAADHLLVALVTWRGVHGLRHLFVGPQILRGTLERTLVLIHRSDHRLSVFPELRGLHSDQG